MDSLSQLFRIGRGPSSSHTMGPVFAVREMRKSFPEACAWRIELFDSLAKTGRGHLTDRAIIQELFPSPAEIVWSPEKTLPEHPNAMTVTPLNAKNEPLDEAHLYYSVGGGTLRRPGEKKETVQSIYVPRNMREVLQWCEEKGLPMWQLVRESEPEVWDHLVEVWQVMKKSIETGLDTEGVLSGGLGVERRAHTWYIKAKRSTPMFQKNVILAAYALAVAEQNASAGIVVTAPTCGAAGVLPGVLRFVSEIYEISEREIVRAIATAGLVGNLIKFNASISGAEAGCQAEIGTACSMAAAAAAQLLGGTPKQIEYAAEMGLEHHLGLTCDPVNGLVQIPCIERNGFGAMRALGCAEFAVISDGSHRISFDQAVQTLLETGLDMCSRYRETAEGGLAKVCHIC